MASYEHAHITWLGSKDTHNLQFAIEVAGWRLLSLHLTVPVPSRHFCGHQQDPDRDRPNSHVMQFSVYVKVMALMCDLHIWVKLVST